MKKYICGIDIGGTKIAVSLGSTKGKVLSRTIFSSLGGKKVRESISQIDLAISELLSEYKLTKRDLLGVGVAVPGAIDPITQILVKSPNLPSWEGVPLKKALTQKIKLPVSVENDANAAALGELFFGAGKHSKDFIYITVSTGIGSGIVVNGVLVRGAKGTAGEVGHMTMVKNGNLCGCGKKGCLEAYSSGTAIASYVKNKLKNGFKSKFFKNIKLNNITGILVAKAAKENDRLAIESRVLAADYLGIALANLINLLNPEKIILGGGVMEQSHHFWQPMMSAARREAWPIAFKSCQIVCSELGKYVTDLGAMALVMEKNKH